MEYISAKQAALNWKLGERHVQFLCANEKIPGAKKMGRQWMIPKEAQRPSDGRTKEGKNQGLYYPYHFTFYIYSKYYASKEELSPDEQSLYAAQVCYLKGDFKTCFDISYTLKKESSLSFVKFAAVILIGYCAFTNGLAKELDIEISYAERLLQKEKEHKEDYRLLLNGLKHHLGWDSSLLLSIDPSKLSEDALIYYQGFLMLNSSISSTVETSAALCIYESVYLQAKKQEILPLNMALCFILGQMNSMKGNIDKARVFQKEGCDIAINEGFEFYLAKYFFTAPAPISEYLNDYNPTYFKRIQVITDRLMENLKLIHILNGGVEIFKDLCIEHTEMLHLMMYGHSNADVATIQGIEEEDVEKNIGRLCKKFNLVDRDELIEYARYQFNCLIKKDDE